MHDVRQFEIVSQDKILILQLRHIQKHAEAGQSLVVLPWFRVLQDCMRDEIHQLINQYAA